MKWPWQKKSVFDCSFYDKNTTKEAMNKINETVDSIFENFDKAKEKLWKFSLSATLDIFPRPNIFSEFEFFL